MKKRECKTKEVELLEKEIRDLKFSLDIAESALDHLLQSKFIRSFRVMNGNGGFVRPIDEADRIAYGKDTPPSDGGVFELQAKAREVINNQDNDIRVINNNMSEWVLCSDRLPEKDGWYILTVGMASLVYCDYYDTKYKEWESYSSSGVRAWMKLPEPYRRDQNAKIM